MKINDLIKQKISSTGLPLEKSLYYLLGIYFNIPTEELKFQKAYSLQLLKLGLLSALGGRYVTVGLFDEESDVEAVTVEEQVLQRLNEYRNLFKKCNNREGMLGNKQECYSKLVRWLYSNPDYTLDTIIKQTALFIKTKQDKNEEDFIPQADYFIYKIINSVEKSTLSTIIDEEFETKIEVFNKVI